MDLKIFILTVLKILKTESRQICLSTSQVEVSYFLNNSMNIDKMSTREKIYFTITWIKKGGWPEKSSIMMMNLERDDVVFMYRPNENNPIQENKRVIVVHPLNSLTVKLQVSFFKNEDDESKWSINFQEREIQAIPIELCSFFVRTDQTPFGLIEHEIVGKDRFVINKYNEGDRVKVTCTLNNGNTRKFVPDFNLMFPKEAPLENFSSGGDPFIKIKIVTLIPKILNKVVSCYVNGGDSASDSAILNFNLKKKKQEKNTRTSVAVSLAVFICILLLALTGIGAYLLIVKQRKDMTKTLVEHHTQLTQIRMSALTSASNMSRVSRLSKISKASRGSDYPPIIRIKTKDRV